jgi:hypothetical protein
VTTLSPGVTNGDAEVIDASNESVKAARARFPGFVRDCRSRRRHGRPLPNGELFATRNTRLFWARELLTERLEQAFGAALAALHRLEPVEEGHLLGEHQVGRVAVGPELDRRQ